MDTFVTALHTIEWIDWKCSKKVEVPSCENSGYWRKIVKEQLDKGLLEMRNTHGENGLSPAQMVFGSEMRSMLPPIRSAILKEKRMNYYN